MLDKMTYLDNSASTRLDERVMDAMKPYYFDTYAVATSEFGYSMGIEAKEGLQEARETIAASIGASAEEIVFTSGETESSNMAIKGVCAALQKKKGEHIIVSKIEDFSVLNTAKNLEKKGYTVDYISVDAEGILDLEELKSKIRDDTVLVSIQHANQEIGTLQDLDAIAKICKEKDLLLHTDATHSYTRVPIDVSKTPVDLISMSAHTIHGPRGVGALYIRKGTPLEKWMDGGYQESNRRAGLENIPGAVGFAKAVELVTPDEIEFLKSLRDYTFERVFDEIPHVTLNGSKKQRTPQNANITFHYVEGESMTLHLDMRGFAVSTGSACFSRSLEASHVILGIGGDHERAHGSIRFTFGRYNSKEDVDAIVDAMKEVVSQLRAISPLFNK
ncbi:cysteine desulfurase family protein [uncultured Methanolobus sp.]|uniref:cysteine desulfurase family protein n=1 Tax=uncultured Methanolobus sp. TaxID=218300 RepID=UPI0029C95B83|nr:cysteine desulfurase family protein [uncultured Methanolobus sp.]